MEAPLILSWQSLVYSEESQCSHSSYNTPPCEAPMPFTIRILDFRPTLGKREPWQEFNSPLSSTFTLPHSQPRHILD